jgi:hypothetical protein
MLVVRSCLVAVLVITGTAKIVSAPNNTIIGSELGIVFGWMELVLAGMVVARLDRAAPTALLALCAGGMLISVTTSKSCGCLGAMELSRGQHLFVIGAVGAVAWYYARSAWLRDAHGS